jgi:hypothetical protein
MLRVLPLDYRFSAPARLVISILTSPLLFLKSFVGRANVLFAVFRNY